MRIKAPPLEKIGVSVPPVFTRPGGRGRIREQVRSKGNGAVTIVAKNGGTTGETGA